jgi:uncharacterized membrane protein YfcA
MTYLLICSVALLAALLTFFSGFGLGTLLLPAFAVFFPIEQAVALTAVVHLLNNLFKLTLVGRHADHAVLLRFGAPAIVAAVLGAWLLVWLADSSATFDYRLAGHAVSVTPVKLAIGLLLMLFVLIELLPRLRDLSVPPRYMALGGLLSGFFGGVSGMQGALRAAFLSRAGLSKEAYVGTGAAIASLIDLTRIGVYATALGATSGDLDDRLLAAAVLAAFAGTWIGNRHLKAASMPGIQRLVAVLLFSVGLGLVSGLL